MLWLLFSYAQMKFALFAKDAMVKRRRRALGKTLSQLRYAEPLRAAGMRILSELEQSGGR